MLHGVETTCLVCNFESSSNKRREDDRASTPSYGAAWLTAANTQKK
jgi:hypothetical protein